MATERLRLFVALELPEHITAVLAGIQSRLREQGLTLRWVRPGNIHLTLKFLGAAPAPAVAAIGQALGAVAAGVAPLTLGIRAGGMFPNARRPRVVWAGLQGDVIPLAGLQRALEERLAARGFDRAQRPFRAHLTLGRFKKRPGAEQLATALETLAAVDSDQFQVRQLGLYQSLLGPDGARYVRLVSARLGAGSTDLGR